MSHTNDLSNLLNLKDPNIFFKDSCVSEERIKGITVKVIEGLNNKIKAIKRIAFGYKSFLHFKNRILITQGILKMKAA